jgi:hypothetical protein
MNGILPILAALSALVTLAILVTGIFSMVRGGEFNRRNSNKLMRARVIAQGVTLALLALWFFSR